MTHRPLQELSSVKFIFAVLDVQCYTSIDFKKNELLLARFIVTLAIRDRGENTKGSVNLKPRPSKLDDLPMSKNVDTQICLKVPLSIASVTRVILGII